MGVSSEFVKRHRHTHASISCFALCVDLAYPCNYDWSFLEGTYKKHRFPLLRFAQADYPSSSQEQVLSRVGWYCELKLTWTRMVLQLSNSKGTKHCWSLANADCNTCSIKVENQWVNRHNFESIMSIMFLWGLSLSSWSHHPLFFCGGSTWTAATRWETKDSKSQGLYACQNQLQWVNRVICIPISCKKVYNMSPTPNAPMGATSGPDSDVLPTVPWCKNC